MAVDLSWECVPINPECCIVKVGNNTLLLGWVNGFQWEKITKEVVIDKIFFSENY